MNCPFCSPNEADRVLFSELCYARLDKYPVNPGHLLVIPHRHFADYFDATDEEKAALWEMVDRCKSLTDSAHQPNGYNIGINAGQSAGQTIMHVHIHLIPRYQGDMAEPAGGVRGVIPGKQRY